MLSKHAIIATTDAAVVNDDDDDDSTRNDRGIALTVQPTSSDAAAAIIASWASDNNNDTYSEHERLLNRNHGNNNATRVSVIDYLDTVNSNNRVIRRMIYNFRLLRRHFQRFSRRKQQCIIIGTASIIILMIIAFAISIAVHNENQLKDLRIVCNFLRFASLSKCQATTSFKNYSVYSTLGSTIPSEIGLLTQLTELALYGNQLIGTIPSTLGSLIQLTWLNLGDNQFTGTIPSTFGNLVQLNWLSFTSCPQLGGTIPSSLCSGTFEIRFYINCSNFVCSCCTSVNAENSPVARCP